MLYCILDNQDDHQGIDCTHDSTAAAAKSLIQAMVKKNGPRRAKPVKQG